MAALVVFYSKSGNTKALAQAYAQRLNADIFEIEERKPRIGNGYVKNGFQASFQYASKVKALPDVSAYETIYVGTPIWASKCAPAINRFLKDTTLKGKKVHGFATLLSKETGAGMQMAKAVQKKGGTFGEFHFVTMVAKEQPDVERLRKLVGDWLK